MESSEAMYKLLTETTSSTYTPDSFLMELQSVCDSVEVELQKDTQLSHQGYEIKPGHRHKKTGLMLSAPDIPETPMYSRRPSRSGLSVFREIMTQRGYEALVSMGPHSVMFVTSTDGHRYLTSEVEDDITNLPHLDYLTPESCYDLLVSFFNPQLGTDTWDTEQETLDDF